MNPLHRIVKSLLLITLISVSAFAGEIQSPELLTRVEAQLPQNVAPPKQDHVLLEFTIDADGKVTDIAVLESAGEPYDKAASDAVQKWTFRPALHEGVAVPSRTRLSFTMPKVVTDSVDAGPVDAPDAGEEIVIRLLDAGIDVLDENPDAGHRGHEMSTTVVGRTVPKSRGSGDFQFEIGGLAFVPRATGGDFLKLAPGILLTNEGGEGHPERIFLRGFDARQGQDLEISVGGVPVNESGNLHGNGYADLNFVIPEVVENLRVIEGPFDPRQGNYAVAGSAEYDLGLTRRGLTAKAGYGSFNAQRLVLMWGPPTQSTKTFGAVQLARTDGFGQNRGAQSARFMAQYEGELSEATTVRIGAVGSTASFQSAGVIREDDFKSGRIGFFDTYDARQGGETLRGSLSANLHYHKENFTFDTTLFGIARGLRIRENFTGFITDVQQPQQSLHDQRGDLLDRDNLLSTIGAKGFGRLRTVWNERPQEVELGYFARFDFTNGQQQRVLAGTEGNTPYKKELDLQTRLGDVGLYVDANVSPLKWLTFRGGVRADVFSFAVDNFCAVQSVRRPSPDNPPGDASCLSQRDFGIYREPTERISATGSAIMPRVSVLVGPFKGVTATASYGDGVRSIDPQFINNSRETPFASIHSWEAGAAYAGRFLERSLDVSGRAIAFGTRVDKDLIFSEQEGRTIIGGSTSRLGALAQGRVRGGFFDASAHVTWVQSKFDDTGLLVPYVPDLVTRLDAAVFHALPLSLLGTQFKGTAALGVTYVGRRALPFGQRSDIIFVTDVNGEVNWRNFTLGLSATNLFNTQYRLAEFNYASDFRTSPGFPTLVPARMFSAGAPRQLMLTLTVNVGGAP